ncbi:MAG: Rpn family recombination-promoting nuclease/putative transposase [Planctomycetota bacterium]|nr:Rpn family recombination-promoting nuclease/putative transposase [Planctomycetota bacterium]
MPTPHDALFCQVFSDPRHAAGELRAMLPAEIGAHADWATLTPAPTAHKDVSQGDRHADLLFTVEVRGAPTYVYLLLEHKSHDDRELVLKLLEYAVRVLLRHTRENPGDPALPPVLALVVHHGPGGFRHAEDLASRYQLDGALGESMSGYLAQFRILVDDLTKATADELRERTLTALARLVLAALREASSAHDLARILRDLSSHFTAAYREGGDLALLGAVLTYLSRIRDTPPQEVQRLIQAELDPEMGHVMISTYDQLLQEGAMRAAVEILLELLTEKFGKLAPETVERVRGARMEELLGWTRSVIRAAELEDVFRVS